MPSSTSSGTASMTSLNACFAADMRDCPSMSRVFMEPLTSSTSSTLGAGRALGPSAVVAAAAVDAAGRAPATTVSSAATTTAARLVVIIGGSY